MDEVEVLSYEPRNQSDSKVIEECSSLWEACFGDTKEYIDFYREEKMKKNRVLHIIQDDTIVSMFHLNPYEIQINDKRHILHYIVGVATNESYRRRGYLRRQMQEAFEQMYEAKEAFTYLMPAAYELYAPYDFRYIYCQRRHQLVLRQELNKISSEAIPWREASRELQELAIKLANERLTTEFTVFTVRSLSYYQSLAKEMSASNGDVVICIGNGRIRGIIAYTVEEETLYFVESILDPEQSKRDMQGLISNVAAKEKFHKIRLLESYFIKEEDLEEIDEFMTSEEKPIIMARVVHAQSALELLSAEEEISFVIAVKDQYLKQNNRVYRVVVGRNGSTVIEEETSYDMKVSIASLTELIFGYAKVEDIVVEEGSEKAREVFLRCKRLDACYINEIV